MDTKDINIIRDSLLDILCEVDSINETIEYIKKNISILERIITKYEKEKLTYTNNPLEDKEEIINEINDDDLYV